MPPMTKTVLPEATRDDQMARWGITPDRTGDDRACNDRRQGRAALNEQTDAPVRKVRHNQALDQRAFLQSGGWTIVHPGGDSDGGTVAHRGLLHPDEYVDHDALQEQVCERLGFDIDEVRAVYRQGPLNPDGQALRDRLDARVLEIMEAGGVMVELGRALGMAVKANGSCTALQNALRRAREAQA